jgi:hypothetical protein
MRDWKREKDLLIEERSKQLMERIKKKMKKSSQNREQIMIEEV